MKVLKAIFGVALPILRSKKFQTFVVGLLANLAVRKIGLDEEAAKELSQQIWIATLTLIGGFAVQDAASGGKTSANFKAE